MNSFVESATLRLIDDTSGKTAKINKALRELDKTAQRLKKSLSGVNLNMKGNTGSIDRMTRKVRELERELKRLQRPTTIRVDARGIDQATTKITRLRREAGRPIDIRTRTTNTDETRSRSDWSSRGSMFGMYAGFELMGIASRFGRAVADMIVDATMQKDVADAKITATTLTSAEAKSARNVAAELAMSPDAKLRGVNEAEILGVLSDTMATVRGDAALSKEVGKVQIKAMGELLAQGMTKEEATTAVVDYVKIADMTGRLFKRDGSIDIERLKKSVKELESIDISGGDDLTSKNMTQSARNLGTFKSTISDDALAMVMTATEEDRTRAASDLNKLRSGLRTMTKAAKLRLRAAGFLELNEKTGETNITNEEEFYKDQYSWLRNTADAWFKKTGRENMSDREKDIAVGNLFSSAGASAGATKIYSTDSKTRQQARRAQVLAELDRPGVAASQSLTLAGDNLVASLYDVSARLAAPFEGPLAAAASGFSAYLDGISKRAVDEKGEPTWLGSALGLLQISGDLAEYATLGGIASKFTQAGVDTLFPADTTPAKEQRAKALTADVDRQQRTVDQANKVIAEAHINLAKAIKAGLSPDLIADAQKQLKLSESERDRMLAGLATAKATAGMKKEGMYPGNILDNFNQPSVKLDSVANGVNATVTALNVFTSGLYDSTGKAKKYSDQLKLAKDRQNASREALGLKPLSDKQFYKTFTKDLNDTVDATLGFKKDNKFGQKEAAALGFGSVKDLQTFLKVPADGVFGPVSASALELSGILSRVAAELGATKLYNKAMETGGSAKDIQSYIQELTTDTVRGPSSTGTELGVSRGKVFQSWLQDQTSGQIKPVVDAAAAAAAKAATMTAAAKAGNLDSRIVEQDPVNTLLGVAGTVGNTLSATFDTVRASIDATFNSASAQAAAAIEGAGASASTAMGGAITAAGNAAAGAMGAAIRNAASSINVNVHTNGPGPGNKALNTGAANLPSVNHRA